MEAERRHVGEGSHRPAVQRRPERVRRVGHDRRGTAGCGVAPAGATPPSSQGGRREVHGEDRPRPRRDGRPDAVGVDEQRARADVRETRLAYRTALDVAANVMGVVTTSSPRARPRRPRRVQAAVPKRDATAWRAPFGETLLEQQDAGGLSSAPAAPPQRRRRRRWSDGRIEAQTIASSASRTRPGPSPDNPGGRPSSCAPAPGHRRGSPRAPSPAAASPVPDRSAGGRSRSGDGCVPTWTIRDSRLDVGGGEIVDPTASWPVPR